MLTVEYQTFSLRHTISGDAPNVIRYLVNEAIDNQSIYVLSVTIDNDSPKDD